MPQQMCSQMVCSTFVRGLVQRSQPDCSNAALTGYNQQKYAAKVHRSAYLKHVLNSAAKEIYRACGLLEKFPLVVVSISLNHHTWCSWIDQLLKAGERLGIGTDSLEVAPRSASGAW